MHKALAPGLTHIQSLTLEDRLVVSAWSPDMAASPVLGTAFVCGLIEWACIEALKPYLGADEHSVGSHIYISHAAPAAVSRKVTAIAELVELKGMTLRFRVEFFDECEQIGSGFHERMLVGPRRGDVVQDDSRFGGRRSAVQ